MRSKARRKRERNKVQEYLHDFLLANPCVDCSETDPVVLEFDHHGEKLFSMGNISRLGIPLFRVIAEIAKCHVRCANCHRRKTYREYGRTHRGVIT